MQLGWYLHRLKAMSFKELWHRVDERLKHRSDATFAHRVQHLELGSVDAQAPPLPASADAPSALNEVLAADARRLVSGNWQLFGWRDVSLPLPPPWHRDPLGDHHTPKDRLAHQLNHRTLPAGVDVRTLWEVSRWSEMVRLAMHGWLNQDISAIATAQSWLEDWVQNNPAGYGIHWTSALESGLRLINFTWFDALVHATGDASLIERQQALAQRIVVPHALWTWRYKSFGSSANNHLLGELVGLLHVVKRWPALEAKICSPATLWVEIEHCVREQFAADGGNKEQALHYHLFAWEMAWHAGRLMPAEFARSEARPLLVRAAEFFARVLHAEEPWHYGDSDDAEVVPLCLERHEAEAEWQAWLKGGSAGEALRYWLGSPPIFVQPHLEWWAAAESGMAVLERQGWQVRLDASPLGFGAMAAHGHGDALHVSLWDGPHALLIDPGTGGYYGMKEKRAALAAWEAHNGPQPLEGFKTPRRMGTFLLLDHHAQPSLEVSGNIARAALWHEGRDWQRSIELAADGSIHILDSVVGGDAGGLGLRLRWHLAPEVSVTPSGDSPSIFVLQRNGSRWTVSFSDAVSCTLATGLASRRYGSFEDCPVIEVRGEKTIKSVWSRG